jgi:hypothetical protein
VRNYNNMMTATLCYYCRFYRSFSMFRSSVIDGTVVGHLVKLFDDGMGFVAND